MASKFVDPASLPTMTFDWGVIKPLVAADNTDGTAVSLMHVILLPGKGHDRHNHPESDEILYILAGEGDQLVVDLQDHAGLQAVGGERVVGTDHRDLDDVRGRALDDRVDGQALAELARLPVARADLRDLAAAAEQRAHVAVLLGLLDGVLH